jgi:carbonic anhydrase
MNKSKLFLICPDCHIEQIIRTNFHGNLFFLTALGSVFDTFSYNYTGCINNFLKSENIREIIVVNDSSCRFIQSVLNNKKGNETNAEEVLQVLFLTCQIELLAEKKLNRRSFKLAELNIKQQVQTLKEDIFIENVLEKKEIKLKGMIYERDKNIFSEINID